MFSVSRSVTWSHLLKPLRADHMSLSLIVRVGTWHRMRKLSNVGSVLSTLATHHCNAYDMTCCDPRLVGLVIFTITHFVVLRQLLLFLALAHPFVLYLLSGGGGEVRHRADAAAGRGGRARRRGGCGAADARAAAAAAGAPGEAYRGGAVAAQDDWAHVFPGEDTLNVSCTHRHWCLCLMPLTQADTDAQIAMSGRIPMRCR